MGMPKYCCRMSIFGNIFVDVMTESWQEYGGTMAIYKKYGDWSLEWTCGVWGLMITEVLDVRNGEGHG